MKKKTAGLLVLISWEASRIEAQPINPSNPTPIDGGLTALMIAGAGYGLKKMRENIN